MSKIPLHEELSMWVAPRSTYRSVKKILKHPQCWKRFVSFPIIPHKEQGWFTLGERELIGATGDFNFGCLIPPILEFFVTSDGIVTSGSGTGVATDDVPIGENRLKWEYGSSAIFGYGGIKYQNSIP